MSLRFASAAGRRSIVGGASDRAAAAAAIGSTRRSANSASTTAAPAAAPGAADGGGVGGNSSDAFPRWRRPRALLLGWTGCRPRHLRRYADAYSELGFDAVCRTEHCRPSLILRPRKTREVAADLLDWMERKGPFRVVHVFSNGGGLVWSALLREAREREGRGRSPSVVLPSSQILDSVPGYLYDFAASVKSLFYFLREITGPLVFIAYPLAVLLGGLHYAMTLQWMPRFSSDRTWKEAWASDAFHCGIRRHLLLYSEDDLLIDSKSVREFAWLLRRHISQGTPNSATMAQDDTSNSHANTATVTEKVWRRSRHVRHIMHHPEEYRRELEDFLSPLMILGALKGKE